MSGEWQAYCRGKDLAVEGDNVLVSLPGGRVHRVSVSDEPDAYRLRSIVVRASVVSQIGDLPLRAWERNRGTELVGFKIDSRGRLVGEGWAPKAGLTAPEFGAYLHAVAMECDRFEFQLTGADTS